MLFPLRSILYVGRHEKEIELPIVFLSSEKIWYII